MKTKLLALFLLAGSTVFAGHIFVGFGVGVPVAPAYGYGYGYAYGAPPPLPPPAAYVAPAPGPGYAYVGGYYYPAGPRYAWRPGYWARHALCRSLLGRPSVLWRPLLPGLLAPVIQRRW